MRQNILGLSDFTFHRATNMLVAESCEVERALGMRRGVMPTSFMVMGRTRSEVYRRDMSRTVLDASGEDVLARVYVPTVHPGSPEVHVLND